MSTQFKHQGKEKKKYVKQMFDDISIHYDRFNLLSSFGIDRYWRNRLIHEIDISSNDALLDVATGTGDVALSVYKKYKARVVGIDIAENMIKLAKQKATKYQSDKIKFLEGDAEFMPFQDNSFNALTISFGFRNLGSYEKALSEFYRVLNQNGRVAILEFSKSKSKWFSPLFNFYFNRIVPRIGAMLSRKDAFLYLPESVDCFLKRKELCAMMSEIGFKNIKYKDYTFGVVTIYVGDKIE